MSFPTGSLAGTSASMSFTTPPGQVPSEAAKLSLSKQTFQWKSGYDSIDTTVPGFDNVVFSLGSQSYRTTIHFDAKGSANALASVRPCFVLAKGTLRVGRPGLDLAVLSMLLSDASFLYETGDILRIRLLQDATVLVDRDFTALGVGRQLTDRFGKLVFIAKTIPDTATTNRMGRFSYNSAKGKLSVMLLGLSLGALSNSQAHVTIELTIKDQTYGTAVTFFGVNPGTYSTTLR
jgi:hypothetical protein